MGNSLKYILENCLQLSRIKIVMLYMVCVLLPIYSFAQSNLVNEIKECKEKAESQFNSQNYESAIVLFNKCIDLCNDKSINLSYKAFLYYRKACTFNSMQNDSDALKDINYALDLDNKNADYYVFRASLLKGQIKILDLNKAIELKPNDSNLYYNRGEEFENQEYLLDACNDYNKAIQLNPNDLGSISSRANLYCKFGLYEEALKEYLDFYKIQRDSDFTCLLNRASIFFKMQKYKEIIKEISFILRNGEVDMEQPYIQRGEAYYLLGNKEKAFEDFLHATKTSINNTSFITLGLFYYDTDNIKEALKSFTQSIKNISDKEWFDSASVSQANLGLALCYMDLKNNDELNIDYKKAIDMNPLLKTANYQSQFLEYISKRFPIKTFKALMLLFANN